MSHKSGKKELEHNSSVSSERFSTSLVLFVGRGVTRAWGALGLPCPWPDAAADHTVEADLQRAPQRRVSGSWLKSFVCFAFELLFDAVEFSISQEEEDGGVR